MLGIPTGNARARHDRARSFAKRFPTTNVSDPAGKRQRAVQRCLVVALALVEGACGPSAQTSLPVASGSDWREFRGSWSAAGIRHTIPLGADRRGSIIELKGTMLLAGPERPGVGFLAETIALVDSETGLVGRSVWRDERGDQVFSDLKGEGTAARNRITGTVLGGTGRYAGATGSYEFSWEFVTEAEDGAIQGRAVDLKGRVRAGQGMSK